VKLLVPDHQYVESNIHALLLQEVSNFFDKPLISLELMNFDLLLGIYP